MKLPIIKIILIVTCIFIIPGGLLAQADLPDEVVDTPIDGGLSLLLAAGAGYVAKKAHDSRKRKAENYKQVP